MSTQRQRAVNAANAAAKREAESGVRVQTEIAATAEAQPCLPGTDRYPTVELLAQSIAASLVTSEASASSTTLSVAIPRGEINDGLRALIDGSTIDLSSTAASADRFQGQPPAVQPARAPRSIGSFRFRPKASK